MKSLSDRLIWLLFVAILGAATLVSPACHRAPEEKRYPFTGRVISIDAQAHSALIDGDNIPDFMEAMAMSYTIKPLAMLHTLSAGDSITAELVAVQSASDHSTTDSWLENIKITGHTTPAVNAGTIHVPSTGDEVPDFAFTNQSGKHISFKQYRGQVLLVTFIYTRCPFPDFCPRMSKNFAEIYRQMDAKAGIHLLSVSFDPEHDTPKVLRDYAFEITHTHDPGLFKRWEFAAPTAAALPEIANFFDLTVKPEGGQITHTLSTALIGMDGKVVKWYHGGDWDVSDVMKDTAAAAQVNSYPGPPSSAPKS